MKLRHDQQQLRRKLAAQGTWIIGRWMVRDCRLFIAAVELQPGWYVDDSKPLTADFDRFARWRTRQGARQWLLEHPRPCVALIHLTPLVRFWKWAGVVDRRRRRVAAATTGPR